MGQLKLQGEHSALAGTNFPDELARKFRTVAYNFACRTGGCLALTAQAIEHSTLFWTPSAEIAERSNSSLKVV